MEGERNIIKVSPSSSIPRYMEGSMYDSTIIFTLASDKLSDIQKMILEYDEGSPGVELSRVEILMRGTIIESIYPYCMEHLRGDTIGKCYSIIDNAVYYMNAGIMDEQIQVRIFYKGNMKGAFLWLTGLHNEGTAEDTAHYALGTVQKCNPISLNEEDVRSYRVGGMLTGIVGTMLRLHVRLVDAGKRQVAIKSVSLLKDGHNIFPERIPPHLLGYLHDDLRLNRTDFDFGGGKYMNGTWEIWCEIEESEIQKDRKLSGWTLQIWGDEVIEITTINGCTEISYK